MRGVLLALAVAALPALALAQTQGQAPAGQAAQGAPHAQTATSPPPHTTGSTTQTGTAGAPAQTPPATPPHAAADAAAPAASNVSLLHTIEPANALERSFVTAVSDETARPAFRRLFLESQVALATVSNDPSAAARVIELGPGGTACLIFTSNARATQVMGAHAPRLMMTGRQALERIRGAPLVIININLAPRLTLDAPGIEEFLALAAGDAAPTAAPPHVSGGPSQ
jgi:hypothetical protein